MRVGYGVTGVPPARARARRTDGAPRAERTDAGAAGRAAEERGRGDGDTRGASPPVPGRTARCSPSPSRTARRGPSRDGPCAPAALRAVARGQPPVPGA
ncbi:hypothetical protein GCM10010389_59210 [Streptomyces echinoruber]|uniref:Uncharacterized protein n=1 Tax=Streptomyces echinoruber TaxID=68898 RepID=A0A918VNY8_9ACTN|nr:hypothetical protein GCM10010389_59210 [Streptomyces echinoruber]